MPRISAAKPLCTCSTYNLWKEPLPHRCPAPPSYCAAGPPPRRPAAVVPPPRCPRRPSGPLSTSPRLTPDSTPRCPAVPPPHLPVASHKESQPPSSATLPRPAGPQGCVPPAVEGVSGGGGGGGDGEGEGDGAAADSEPPHRARPAKPPKQIQLATLQKLSRKTKPKKVRF